MSAASDTVFQHDRFLLWEERFHFSRKVRVENEQEQRLLLIEGPPRLKQACCAAAIFVLVVLVFLLRPEGPNREVWNQMAVFLTAVILLYAVVLHPSRWERGRLTFYRDAGNSEELCNVSEESWSLRKARYKLAGEGGVCLGRLHRERGCWRCEDAQGHEICKTRMERGPLCFFETETDWKTLGVLSLKPRSVFSRLYCTLDLSNDAQHCLDPRLALAVAAMLAPQLMGMEPD